jgi:hypothetical protein
MKKFIVLIISIVVLVAAVCSFLKFTNFDFSDFFNTKPIVIGQTTNIVEEIRRLAELTTITYYGDYAIVKKKQRAVKIFGLTLYNTEDELVLIVKGKVRAGFDLSKLQKLDIMTDSISMITLKLPKAKVLDIITNPSDFETFEENGNWSYEEITKFKREARTAIEQYAMKIGILEMAEKAGKENFTSFFKALGFQTVVIEI